MLPERRDLIGTTHADRIEKRSNDRFSHFHAPSARGPSCAAKRSFQRVDRDEHDQHPPQRLHASTWIAKNTIPTAPTASDPHHTDRMRVSAAIAPSAIDTWNSATAFAKP